MAFVERWHLETLSFHLPHGEITITIYDIACLLHIPIRGTLLSHGRLVKEEAREMLIEEMRADSEDALEEVERTRETHVRFHFLRHPTVCGHELVVYNRCLPEVFIRYRMCPRVQLGSGYTRGWILQHFPDIIGWGEVSGYTEAMSRARAFVPFRGNHVSDPFRRCLDLMAAEDVRYDCYDDHREAVLWNDIALYYGWLASSLTIIIRYLPERAVG
ncbi:uncharacterized protein LOC131623735 [Vicia villosa]|uniref:uncharacterized protein LOC131623735 n=1 Tax=Vicia villosa TaxID=3911 RepID=UPI00273B5B21|nr:uncharacterized protein LOC131623735 [Vicia villosa]